MNKRILLPLFFGVTLFLSANAQVGVNQDNSPADPSAMLDVKSTDKGVLIPRMTTAERQGITGPARGLLVFDTTTNSFWFFNGSVWEEINTDDQTLSLIGSELSIEDGNSVDLSNIDLNLSGNDLLTTPLNCPSLAGTLNGIGNFPEGVAASGNYAYLINSASNDLKVVDISDPSSPSIVATLPGFPLTEEIKVAGDYAYVVRRGFK